MQGRVNRANVKKNKTKKKQLFLNVDCSFQVKGKTPDAKVKCQRESSKKGLFLLFILHNDCGGILLKVAPVYGGLVLKAVWFI